MKKIDEISLEKAKKLFEIGYINNDQNRKG